MGVGSEERKEREVSPSLGSLKRSFSQAGRGSGRGETRRRYCHQWDLRIRLNFQQNVEKKKSRPSLRIREGVDWKRSEGTGNEFLQRSPEVLRPRPFLHGKKKALTCRYGWKFEGYTRTTCGKKRGQDFVSARCLERGGNPTAQRLTADN